MAPRRAAGRTPEVAEIFRARGQAYREAHRLSAAQRRAMRAIETCRTPALGGHLQACDRCGAVVLHYHSCGNRHCPRCQTLAKLRWVEARGVELLAIEQYFHVVFTLPHALNPLAQGNPRIVYDLLFHCAAATLREFAANPRWLGGELGVSMVLHTWGQDLGQHIHVHCVVTGGALSADGQRWIPAKHRFLFPVRALSRVFRAKYLQALQTAFAHEKLALAGSTAQLAGPAKLATFLRELRANDWVVYAKPPFAGPEQVIAYLGRYTHRIAISNNRLVSFDGNTVRFRARDYRHANRVKTLRVDVEEFIRRFLLHVLPTGFMRIRHFGLLANRSRASKLAQARVALDQPPPPKPPPTESAPEAMLRLTGIDVLLCPHCRRGRLCIVASFPPDSGTFLPPPTGPPRGPPP
jgi:hypothetical protein